MDRRDFLAAVSFGFAMPGMATHALAAAKGAADDPRFATSVTTQVGGKPMRMVLTGTAMRTKYFLSVYAIGSYVQEGVKVRDADRLATINAPKQLRLIFEREIDGATMARSFRESIGMGHPEPEFGPELAKLEQFFLANPCKQGDNLWLTFVPGVGLSCQPVGKAGTLIENVKFAQAAWEVYLGPKNVGLAIKSGLSSRL